MTRIAPSVIICADPALSGSPSMASYHSGLARTAARLLCLVPRAPYSSGKLYCGDRPIAFLASDRNSEAVEFVKPKPVHCPGLSVSQYHRFPDKLDSSPFELDQNPAGSRLSVCHGGLLVGGLGWLKASGRDGRATFACIHVLRPAPAFEQEPDARFGFVEPVFDHTHACHIINSAADDVRLAHKAG